MKIVYINKDVHLGAAAASFELKAEAWYVMSDTDFRQFSNIMPDRIGGSRDFLEIYKEYKGEDLNGKTLLAFRTGGIGDLLFMTPSLRLIKERYKDVKIVVCAGFIWKDTLKENPYIDELYHMPFNVEIAEKADFHVMFQGLIEENKRAEKINAYDLFMEQFHIDWKQVDLEHKQPVITFSDAELRWGAGFMKKNKLKTNTFRIGFQLESSSPVRTFPPDKNFTILRILLEEGFTVFVFGGGRQRTSCEEIATGFSDYVDKSLFLLPLKGFTLRQSFIIGSVCNLFIGPDSAFIHVAGAFKIPQIGLYGPFPSRLRMLYYHNAIGLNASTACSACFKHGHWPCAKGSPSPCYSVLTVNNVLEAADYLMNRFYKVGLQIGKDKWRQTEAQKTIPRFKKYMKGKGLDVGSGYFRPDNGVKMEALDYNPLCSPDLIINVMEEKFDRTWPFVFSSFMLQEVPDRDMRIKVLSNMFSIVGPNGYLLLYLPHKAHYPGSDLDEDHVKELLEGFPNMEIVHSEKHAEKTMKEFDKLDKDKDEYAFSMVIRKLP